MTFNLESIGFTKEEIQQRVIDRICDQITKAEYYNEEGEPVPGKTQFYMRLAEDIKKRVDRTISELAEKHVLPNVQKYIEEVMLQATNAWGEKQGKSLSFVEYLVSRAENYIQEKVDYKGKSKVEASDYAWSGTQTRIAHLIHEYLHYSIDAAMKAALQGANSQITNAIAETAKLKLIEISKSLQVQVKTK